MKAYVEAMGQAVTAEDAKTEADALISRLYLRAEQGWIEQHADQYEEGLEKFREALRRFTTGEVKSLSLALNILSAPTVLYPTMKIFHARLNSYYLNKEKAAEAGFGDGMITTVRFPSSGLIHKITDNGANVKLEIQK